MSLVHQGYVARPFECPQCGTAVQLPAKDEALLDERGWAHVPCSCGRVNVVPFDPVAPETGRAKRRPSWQLAALWIVIIGMIALLIPVLRREPAPEPEPPIYLTT
jgi:hypothetical protein